MSAPGRARGFTLTELAVVFAIVSILLGSLTYTLSAQVEQRNFQETERRLTEARELLLGFALVNGRLPCPASGTSAGAEDGGGATVCATHYGGAGTGYLPATTIGFQPVDSGGYALDAWGQRIRYAVSATTWGTTPFARFTKTHVANDTTAAWSVTQTPADLVVCSASPAVVTATSCDAGTSVTNQNTVVAVVYSTGKNTTTGGTGTNEARNLDGNQLFVSRTRDPSSAAGGEFDDQMLWIPVGLLYGRLIAAGVLP